MFVSSRGVILDSLEVASQFVCVFLAAVEGPRLVADDILEWSGHRGLAPRLSAGDKGMGRQTHYDDVRRHQPPQSAHIQRFHVAGG